MHWFPSRSSKRYFGNEHLGFVNRSHQQSLDELCAAEEAAVPYRQLQKGSHSPFTEQGLLWCWARSTRRAGIIPHRYGYRISHKMCASHAVMPWATCWDSPLPTSCSSKAILQCNGCIILSLNIKNQTAMASRQCTYCFRILMYFQTIKKSINKSKYKSIWKKWYCLREK